MTNRMNDANELNVYCTLAKFSQNAWKSYRSSLKCSKDLLYAVQELLKDNHQPSDDFVGHIITTIDLVLYQDCNNSRSSQRRECVTRSCGSLQEFDLSLYFLYLTLRELNFERIYNQIDGSLFCRHRFRIFIFPGYPSGLERERGYQYSHGKFLPPPQNNAFAKWIPFDNVQHVVHNVKDLLNFLHLTEPKRKTDVGLRLCLKGRPHSVYNGPDLIWFSPRPSTNSSNSQVCPSLDPDNSRYGCFRVSLPFRVIEKRYPKVYRLGTRKFKKEHCHSFLLTPSGKRIMFIEELQPIQFASSEFVKKENPDQFYWLCYRDDVDRAWDIVDFAISASELKLAIIDDQIRLDFVNHSNPCVPSIKTRTCDSPKKKTDAMQCFLKELKNINTEVSKLKNIFQDDVYNDLIQLTI
jgi:hypothetical protein